MARHPAAVITSYSFVITIYRIAGCGSIDALKRKKPPIKEADCGVCFGGSFSQFMGVLLPSLTPYGIIHLVGSLLFM
jgi:hypothetical protein